MQEPKTISTHHTVPLLFFTALVGFLFADQNLMAPSLTAIGEEFGFTREQIDARLGADINLIFWMLGGVVTLGVGYLADRADLTKRFNRKWMLVSVVTLGQLACLCSGLAHSYEQLYWSRAFTGIGIGGSIPLIYSLLSDYFPPQKRASAAATMSLTMGLGIAIGQVMAGSLAPAYGWRFPFLVVALPGMAVTALFALFAKEPARGQQEQALQQRLAAGGRYEERIRLKDIPLIFRVRSNALVFLQAIPGSIPWGMIFVYFNDFYAHDKGYSPGDATLLVMVLGAFAIAGGFFGGLLGQKLFNKHPRYLPILCGVTTLLGMIPTTVLIWYPGASAGSIVTPILIGSLTGLLASVTGPNVNAILMNANPPERRGAVFGLFNLCNDLGKGFGASVVGWMAASLGRVTAFHLSNAMWLFSGVLMLVLAGYFPRDQAAMQADLARK